MVAFSSFVVTLFAVAGSLASPTAEIKRADDSPTNFVLGRDSLSVGLQGSCILILDPDRFNLTVGGRQRLFSWTKTTL
jgi:hypothetical protein